jgi:hypothetical protein
LSSFALSTPTKEEIACQAPKPILLNIGDMDVIIYFIYVILLFFFLFIREFVILVFIFILLICYFFVISYLI